MLAENVWSVLNSDVIGIIMGCLIPISAIIGGFWYQTERVRSESALKMRMLDQGMSADEIERVIQARPGRRGCGPKKE